MRTTFTRLALIVFITFSSCDTAKTIEYKYAESPKLLACDFPNGDLYKEAVYAFENDIINNYDPKYKNPAKAYSNFINLRTRGTLKVTDIASAHSLTIAKLLKKETSMWNKQNGIVGLNTSHSLVDCIANNIKDKDIKATFNALLTTNNLEPKYLLPLLSSSARFIQTDGNLKSYVALELFYAQLLEVQLEALKNPNPQPELEPAKPAMENVNFNRTPAARQ